MSSLPRCQRCGATPPVFYSRDLPTRDKCERLCAVCIRPYMPRNWRLDLDVTTAGAREFPPLQRRIA